VKQGESDLATDWEVLPTGTIARGGLIKQPEKTELRQLKLWSTFFVACRPTTARNLNLLPSGRNQYAPVNEPRDRHETFAGNSTPIEPVYVFIGGRSPAASLEQAQLYRQILD